MKFISGTVKNTSKSSAESQFLHTDDWETLRYGFSFDLEKAILVSMAMACSSGPTGDYECPEEAIECPENCYYGIQCADSYFQGGIVCYCFEPDR